VLYPLSYGGSLGQHEGYQRVRISVHTATIPA
jgi:hypothetical protein